MTLRARSEDVVNAVSVRGLTKRFGERVVLDRLDLDLRADTVVAMLGRSGSGKSTLVRVLAGLIEPDASARLSVGSVAVAFQQPRLLPWLSVWRNVALALEGRGMPLRDRRAAALAMLREVDLADRADDWPLALSGGQAQRVALARALVREPDVLLLDEPFSGLDALTRLTMHELVRNLQERHHRAILLVTHDVDEAIALADEVVVLDGGRIAASHTVRCSSPTLRHDLLAELGVTSSGVSSCCARSAGRPGHSLRPGS